MDSTAFDMHIDQFSSKLNLVSCGATKIYSVKEVLPMKQVQEGANDFTSQM